ncbi:unnamed protein product [Rotaria sp. Silwood2]|nr:unnamed protein product [Rotaria sp. Silwood2]CAF3070742.1 unnamed protein product [Rotaria sp. Silwood2]CAF3127745.1 unnamed protein product [Rotaria sp. Silwood2]CAF3429887.1 unnamed protein product [Rotaria sp. Silwood2]CAF4095486.1 unnamed protein product [Rotaria sp. Silwood2]
MAQLQVHVIEARNLKQKDKFSEDDAFIEIYLDDINQKRRTKVKQNSNNPTWDESFVFNHLQGQNILHIDVYDEDTIKNERIGSLQIDLHRLYDKNYIDDWFCIEDKHGIQVQGEIHLHLYYEKLKI